jgi:hypothetical protein
VATRSTLCAPRGRAATALVDGITEGSRLAGTGAGRCPRPRLHRDALGVHLVTSAAVGTGQSAPLVGEARVFFPRNELHVPDVDTGLRAADVIHGEARRDRLDQQLIDEPMHLSEAAEVGDSSIPLLVVRSGPADAAGLRVEDGARFQTFKDGPLHRPPSGRPSCSNWRCCFRARRTRYRFSGSDAAGVGETSEIADRIASTLSRKRHLRATQTGSSEDVAACHAWMTVAVSVWPGGAVGPAAGLLRLSSCATVRRSWDGRCKGFCEVAPARATLFFVLPGSFLITVCTVVNCSLSGF